MHPRGFVLCGCLVEFHFTAAVFRTLLKIHSYLIILEFSTASLPDTKTASVQASLLAVLATGILTFERRHHMVGVANITVLVFLATVCLIATRVFRRFLRLFAF